MLSIVLTLLAAAAECPRQPDAQLIALDYDTFDTAPGKQAWRSLLGRGCIDAAVATLVAYRKTNSARMTAEQTGELSFHIGQALAMSGRERESIPYFQVAAGPRGTPEWSAYVAAHLGFVHKDRARIKDALVAYEKIALPGSLRLGFIRGFLRCMDKPYMEAVHCGM